MTTEAVREVLERHGSGKYTAILTTGKLPVRLFVSTGGSLCKFSPHSRRRGPYLASVEVEQWLRLEPPKDKTETPGQRTAREHRQWRDYVLAKTAPGWWAELKEDARQLTDEKLSAIAAMTGADSYEVYKQVSAMHLKGADNGYKTCGLSQCPDDIRERIRAKSQAREKFSEYWRGSYDYHVSGQLSEDGTNYRASFSAEYKGCGNGHYYLMLNPTGNCIFCEDD